jgi:hypothetical protein
VKYLSLRREFCHPFISNRLGWCCLQQLIITLLFLSCTLKARFAFKILQQIEGYYWRPIFTHIFKCKLKILMEPRASILYNITILNEEMLQLTFAYPQINYDFE